MGKCTWSGIVTSSRCQHCARSKKVRRRVRKRFDEDAKLNESVQASNCWYSSQTRNVFRPPLSSLDAVGEAAPRQAEVLHGLLGDVRRYDTWKAEAEGETDEEALGVLLRKAEFK